MDGPPAVALGIEKRHADVMNEPPRSLDETLPNSTDRSLIFMLGMVMFVGTAAVFWFSGGGIISSDEPCTEFDGSIDDGYIDPVNGYCLEEEWRMDAEDRFLQAQTTAFAVFIVFQLFNVINCRSTDRSIFQLGVFSNKAIAISFAISASLLLFMVQGAYLTIPITSFLSVSSCGVHNIEQVLKGFRKEI